MCLITLHRAEHFGSRKLNET